MTSETWVSSVIDAGMNMDWRNDIDNKFMHYNNVNDELLIIINKVISGQRITVDEGVKLHDECDLPTLGTVSYTHLTLPTNREV